MVIRWGVLGAATIAKEKVIPAIQKAGGEIVGIASKSNTLINLKEQYNISFTFDDYEQLLKVEEIEAVYIPLPNSEHFHWVMKAIEYGKHVLVEKPIVLTKSELLQIKEKANEKGLFILEAFMYRHHPQIKEAKRLLFEGAIGDIVTIRSQFHFELLDWENDIRVNPSLGGGVLRDIGCYCINIQQLFLEEDVSKLQVIHSKRAALDVHIAANLLYENGVLGIMDCSFYGSFSQNVDITGTKGIMRLPYAFRTDLNQHTGVIEIVRGEEMEQVYLEGDAYHLQIEHFHEVILEELESNYMWNEMLMQMELLEQLQYELEGGAGICQK